MSFLFIDKNLPSNDILSAFNTRYVTCVCVHNMFRSAYTRPHTYACCAKLCVTSANTKYIEACAHTHTHEHSDYIHPCAQYTHELIRNVKRFAFSLISPIQFSVTEQEGRK